MRSAVSGWGHLVGCLSTSSRVMLRRSLRNSEETGSSTSSLSESVFDGFENGMWILPTEETKATISIPKVCLRYFSAIAPAATRPGIKIELMRGGNCDGEDHTNGLAGTAASTTAAGLDAILLEVGVVGVTRPGVEISLGIIMRALILVLDEESNRRAQCHAVLNTRLEVNEILLVTLFAVQTISSGRRKRDEPRSQEW